MLCTQLLVPVTSACLEYMNCKPNLHMCLCTVSLEVIIMQSQPLKQYHGIRRGFTYTNLWESYTIIYVTGPAKINDVSTKNRRFLACLLYHNLITIYSTATKSLSLLQNFMGFFLRLTKMG